MQSTPEEREGHRICVVLPAFREARMIGEVIGRILPHCADVIVVDDGSDDGTADVAEDAGGTVIRLDVNQGKGVALNTGFKYALEHGFDAVITLDSDGQHDPDEIPDFIAAYRRTGIPVLVGNRLAAADNMPRIRWWTNRFMSWLLSKVMGQYVPDSQCGYRLYRSDVLGYVTATSERFAAESESLLHLADRGIRMDAVRIKTIYGDEKSKINPFTDTIRFFAMLINHVRDRKRNREP